MIQTRVLKQSCLYTIAFYDVHKAISSAIDQDVINVDIHWETN